MLETRRNFLRRTASGSAAVLAGLAGSDTASAQLASPPTTGGVTETSVPLAAQIAIKDLLDQGARLAPGKRVLIVAYLDGLYGGDNLVDRDAIHWLTSAVKSRGNPVEVLWVEQVARKNEWAFPNVVRAAMDRADITINHSFDLTVEEILSFRNYTETQHHNPIVRNFATTSSLLCTPWAQTPQELVSEIRYQAARQIQVGARWVLTDPNGTHLEGTILPPRGAFKEYAIRREAGSYRPWPEWVCPPILLGDTNGTYTFDRTLSWWSRYVGISPYFQHPVTLTINNGRIDKIEGGAEAEAIRNYLESLRPKVGDAVYAFDTMHFGVHPQAHVSEYQCPSVLYRRLIEHCDTHNLHIHVGSPAGTPAFPYFLHLTGDIRRATFKIGETLVYENGRLMVLDDPAVKAVAARYPGRPGLGREPFQG